ncbi:enhancer of polycomb homolog 1 isoform X2 [Callorhinchus milii]|uniref:enhancer of polycomb homolog 1 isoform X2 n=1 Tax=Callorhinchus milii TaxID=7868 RepID=UPI001C3F719B|nr:enhancer of polycomb homolog 1 isoform X2 [Callorhinchus milii]
MSKLSFRARALDASKPLPVYRCEDLPDLHEYASINRAVPQMPTGMEKEEESEHHLQRAISAQQVYGEKRDNMVIPVPEAESNIAYYESVYSGEFKMPKQLIHIQPFSLDAEQPDYDMDSDDEVFVNKLRKKMDITPLQFEEMIDRLEKGSGQQLVTLQEAKLLLKEDDDLIREVYEYWIRKRKNCRGCSLIPTVKQEKRDGSSTNDPYVAFRRRTEKMQTRKNRKNDEASYEKMLKLRRDLSRAVTILEMIKRREKSKRELLHLTLEIVEKRHSLGDFNGEILSEQENVEIIRPKRKYEKKKHKVLQPTAAAPQQTSPAALPVFNAKDMNQYDFPSSDEEPFSQVHSASSEAEEENDPDGSFAFRRKAGCQYYSPRLDQMGNWPWCSPEDGGLGDVRYRYCLTTLTVPRRCIGFARRRVGRGGRILLDRTHTENDRILHQLDPEMLSSPPHSPFNEFANTSQTNTSDCPSRDLTQILENIKACRWRHFRPRSPPLQDNDRDELSSRKLYRGINRIVTAQPGTQPCSTSVSSKSSGTGSTQISAFTAEQYQQHQQQLVLMQKQQLAQIQQQLAHSNSGSNTSQGSVSKTLDSVSAQFAASALVTSEQLMAYKAKEEVVLGINGVLQASGSYKGLHLTSTTTTALVQTSQSCSSSSVGSALLSPCSNILTASSHGALSHHGSATNSSTPQLLLGNNLRLGVPGSVATVNSVTSLNARHIPRTLNTVPQSALKLATAANCQVPKVPGSSSMDGVPRENHDTEKPALNSIADKTVAMEVT